MTKLPTTPYGTRLGFTSRQQYLDFLTKQPRPLPALLRPKRRLTPLQYGLCVALWVVLTPVLLLGFLVLGEFPRLKS